MSIPNSTFTIEIGSEFSNTTLQQGSGIEYSRTCSLVFSGRTAIEAVLASIPNAKTALLPSYCCDSMIEPFRSAGLDIDYYDVYYDDALRFDFKSTADIILWNNYFGFSHEIPDFDGVVVEDITHSFFSDKQHHIRSDFLIASLRKWGPLVSGGYCSVSTNYPGPPVEFVRNKLEAMSQKELYLNGTASLSKKTYLEMFKNSNEWLSNNYSELAIDAYSKKYLENIDVNHLRNARRSNAGVLYEGLKERVQFMFPFESMDCPLFVPIILPKNREKVRQHLIDNDIFCPVHWPHPNANCESNLYDFELSLVCDQRYVEEDMERIVSVLKEVL